MSNALVTGGTGFVGSHVVRRLCAEGLTVRVLARRTSPLRLLESLPVEVVFGDLLDPKSLRKAVAGCDTVFHVAADYRIWARHPQELYRNNVEGTEQILAAAQEAGIRRFVYTSTVGTIGFSKNGAEGTEEDFPDPGLDLGGVRDVRAGHWAAMLRGKPGERYILGGQNLSLKEILDTLA